MKKEALLIHCARGGIVNEDDLYEALKEGHLSGAALDVFVKEPPGNQPLFTLDNVICTPHLGAATEEAQVKVGIETAEQLIDYFKNGAIRNAVNMPSLTPEQLAQLASQGYTDPQQFFQAVIDGKENIWSLININFLGELFKMSRESGFLVNALLLYINHLAWELTKEPQMFIPEA